MKGRITMSIKETERIAIVEKLIDKKNNYTRSIKNNWSNNKTSKKNKSLLNRRDCKSNIVVAK